MSLDELRRLAAAGGGGGGPAAGGFDSAPAPALQPTQLIGKGSYGCVYSPALRCAGEPNTIPQSSRVSKLMTKAEATKELNESVWVQGINGSSQFTVSATKQCNLNQENRLPGRHGRQINACNILTKANLDSASLLYMDNGGNNVKKTLFTPEEILPFFRSFQNLFDGIVQFQKNDVVHMDIKKDNVVTRKNDDGTFTTRFIDFGISIPLRDAYFTKIRSPDLTTTHYFVWPPYSKFAGKYFYGDRAGGVSKLINDISDIIYNDYYTIFIRDVGKEGPQPPQWRSTKSINTAPFVAFWTDPKVVDWLAEFKMKTVEEQNATKFTADLPIYEFIRKIMVGIDVHGLGILLAGMYYSLVGQKSWPRGYMMREKLIPQTSSDRAFADTLYTTVTEPLERLIAGMMSHDVNAYTSIEEASRIYRDEIMPKMEEHMATPNFIALTTKYPGPQTQIQIQKAGFRRSRKSKSKTTRKTKRKTL